VYREAQDETATLIAPFDPLPWQIAPFRDKHSIMLLTGSAGGGKSRVLGEKIHAFCLHYPGASALILRKTREVLKSSTIDFMRTVVIGSDPSVRWRPSEFRLQYDNGSAILFGGMRDSMQREQIRGIGGTGGIDIAWMEEATAFEEPDYQEVLPRLRALAVQNYWLSKGVPFDVARKKSWHQLMLSTNPDNPYHWIKQRLIDGGEAQVYLSNYKQNLYNPVIYGKMLKKLTGVQRKRLLDGEWMQAEGMVYSEYTGASLIDPFDIPEHWVRFRSIDFGYTNPFVCLWVAMDEDGNLYVYRQLYHTGRTVNDHAQQINALSQGEYYEATVADHDAEDRATLEQHDISTVPAKKDVSLGIQAVKNRLRPSGKNGKPRLYIMKNCVVEYDPELQSIYHPIGVEQEIYFYIWDARWSAITGLKEIPVKKFDHALDALRYLVMYIDDYNLVDIAPLRDIYKKQPAA
jgi:phage terminase large subunit